MVRKYIRLCVIVACHFVDPYYYRLGDSRKSHLLYPAVGLNLPYGGLQVNKIPGQPYRYRTAGPGLAVRQAVCGPYSHYQQ